MNTDIIESSQAGVSAAREFKLLAVVFGGLLAILLLGYFLFLRLNYAPIYENLNASDASLIVEELDSREIKYRLSDGGKRISVPAAKADSVRLGVVSSVSHSKKPAGFELFDESEMGLTEFAQKIKYQRALQGELSRTIMMMTGIEQARVHIAMPERVLFRGNASRPTAAVTLIGKPDVLSDKSRIAGIRRLVAASVPDMELEHVVVLTATGEIISRQQDETTARLNKLDLIAAAHERMIKSAIYEETDGLDFDISVSAIPAITETIQTNQETDETSQVEGRRDYALNIILRTNSVLPESQQAEILKRIENSAQINRQAGDALIFKLRSNPIFFDHEKPAMDGSIAAPGQSTATKTQSTPLKAALSPGLIFATAILSVIAALALALGVFIVRRRQSALSPRQHLEFANHLTSQLRKTGA